MNNPTCEDLIYDQMIGREEQLQELLDKTDEYGDLEDNSIYEFALHVEEYIVVRIDLSTGGPADYLECKITKGDYYTEITSIQYHYADWFDHAEMKVDEDSPLWTYCEMIVDSFITARFMR